MNSMVEDQLIAAAYSIPNSIQHLLNKIDCFRLKNKQITGD